MKSDRSYERLGHRYGRLVKLVSLAFILLTSLVLFWFYLTSRPERQVTLVIAAEPTTVAFFDRDRHKLVLLSFPASANITGVNAVGQYSLEALWSLGKIDPKDRLLLPQSLEETVGVPISEYLGFKTQPLPSFSDSLSLVREIFSFSQILALISGKYRTNLPLPTFVALVFETGKLRPDEITLLKVNLATALVETSLPDGTKVNVVDPNRLGVLVGSVFEDERIRREAVHVAILNTTAAPELGRRVERLLSHLGVLVVVVGNDSPPIDQCLISGEKRFLQTTTAQFIASHYQCLLKEATEGSRADLVVRLGRAYERRFLPQP